MKRILLICTFALLLVPIASAQMETWTWDAYKTQFQVPAGFQLQQNDADGFSAGNSDMNLTLYPRKVSGITYAQMESSLREWTAENGVKPDAAGYQYLDDLNGYWGVMTDGSYDGSPVFLMMVMDPDYTDIALYVWISYNQASYNTALKVLKSFTPN